MVNLTLLAHFRRGFVHVSGVDRLLRLYTHWMMSDAFFILIDFLFDHFFLSAVFNEIYLFYMFSFSAFDYQYLIH